jgi:predicted nucleic acid-binding protein
LTIYLDTSAAVPLFVPEPTSEAIIAWFAACSDPLVAADWIVTELASALSIKTRRGDITADQAHSAWNEFELFCGTGLRLVQVSRSAFMQAARLAQDAGNGLRSGDSLHLAVAIEINATGLATADRNLEANAKRLGLNVFGF